MFDLPTQATKGLTITRHGQRGRGRGNHARGGSGRYNSRRRSDNSTRSFWYCLKSGHSQSDCFVKKKADEGRRERMKRQTSKGSELQGPSASVSLADAHALMTKRQSFKYTLGDWFIDSGATDHMSNEQGDFYTLKRLHTSIRVVLGDNTAVYAYGIGKIYLNSQVCLKQVLFVPDFGARLLSVSTVTQLGYHITFDRFRCKIWKENINILSASPAGNLFKVDIHHANISKATPNESTNTECLTHSRALEKGQLDNVILTNSSTQQPRPDLQLGHQPLGHLNIPDVRRQARLSTGRGIKQTHSRLQLCPPCLQGKQKRLFN